MKEAIVSIGIGITISVLMVTSHLYRLTKHKDIQLHELQERNKVLEKENVVLNALNERSKTSQEELTVIVDIQTLKIKKIMNRLDASMEKYREYFVELHDHFDVFINNLEEADIDPLLKSDLVTEALVIHTEIDNFLPSPYEQVNSYYPYLIALLIFAFITKVLFLRNSKYLNIKSTKIIND